jgi:hypothetical protein
MAAIKQKMITQIDCYSTSWEGKWEVDPKNLCVVCGRVITHKKYSTRICLDSDCKEQFVIIGGMKK